MKTSLFASVVFFYSALLLTMAGTPLLLTHSEPGVRHADAQVWDRFLGAKPVDSAEKVARMPLTDTPLSGASTRRVPMDKLLPDAGMISKPADKLRARNAKA